MSSPSPDEGTSHPLLSNSPIFAAAPPEILAAIHALELAGTCPLLIMLIRDEGTHRIRAHIENTDPRVWDTGIEEVLAAIAKILARNPMMSDGIVGYALAIPEDHRAIYMGRDRTFDSIALADENTTRMSIVMPAVRGLLTLIDAINGQTPHIAR